MSNKYNEAREAVVRLYNEGKRSKEHMEMVIETINKEEAKENEMWEQEYKRVMDEEMEAVRLEFEREVREEREYIERISKDIDAYIAEAYKEEAEQVYKIIKTLVEENQITAIDMAKIIAECNYSYTMIEDWLDFYLEYNDEYTPF